MDKDKVFENEYFRLYVIEPGVLGSTYKKGKHFTLEVVKALVPPRIEFQEGRQYPWIVTLEDINADRDARDYLATPEATKDITAVAILTHSPLMNIVGNMYIYMSRPAIPTKLFNTKEGALIWIRKMNHDSQDLKGFP